jgi:hypothetical protein
MCVCHTCDNPACVNIDHLWLGTHTDNMKDMEAKGRSRRSGVLGERHGSAKLTNETATYAMARLLAGETQVSVAKAFGVSGTVISCLWRGQTWSHLFSQSVVK